MELYKTVKQDHAGLAGGDVGTVQPPTVTYEIETFYTPLVVGTGIFGALFIIAPYVVRRGEDQEDIRFCIRLAIVCMWLFWATVYVSQMNPLVGPTVKNTTLAWIAYTWGNQAKSPPNTTFVTAKSIRTKAIKTTLSSFENITTAISGSTRCNYVFRNFSPATRLNFRLMAFENVYIILTDSTNLDVPYIELTMGYYNNQKSAISKTVNYENDEKVSEDTPNILDGKRYRGYWMKWVNGHMTAGYQNQDSPFISWTDPDPIQGKHVGLCTKFPSGGQWLIEIL